MTTRSSPPEIVPEPVPSLVTSPPWGSTTKLVVGLTVVAIIAALMIRFRNLIGPLILAFILTYLLHPLAGLVSSRMRVPWRTAVNLIFLLLLLIVSASFAVTGFATVQQIESLVGVVQRFVTQLPDMLESISQQVYTIGPFQLNFPQLTSQLNLETLTDQLLGNVQAVLGNVAGMVSSFAASAASTLGWTAFILLISYFLLADAGGIKFNIVQVDVPGYNRDIQLLGVELRKIWNAFLRGQLIIILLVVISYTLLLSILGVRYAAGLALLAGLARFVPYIGPLIAGLVTFLVAFFQNGNFWGLQPLTFAVMVVIITVVMDQIFDNLVTPRFLGQTLGVHPAGVMVAALIATNLIGIVGLILAAPVLATIQLLGRYVLRKMFDLDPWPDTDPSIRMAPLSLTRGTRLLRSWWGKLRRS